jgi:hypothetical protein
MLEPHVGTWARVYNVSFRSSSFILGIHKGRREHHSSFPWVLTVASDAFAHPWGTQGERR